jgi:phosphatidylethanolamine N-methyltransferase
MKAERRPHMKRLYGERLRKDGGLTKTLKSVAGKTLPKAGRHAPEIERVVREVQGSLEKVEEKMTGAVEDFLDHGELTCDLRVANVQPDHDSKE